MLNYETNTHPEVDDLYREAKDSLNNNNNNNEQERERDKHHAQVTELGSFALKYIYLEVKNF